MSPKLRQLRREQFSRALQARIHRHESRISRNLVYCSADLEAGGDHAKAADSPVPDEVRQFYKMRLRDAAAFDQPYLQMADFFDHRPDDVVEVRWEITELDVLMLHRALDHHLADWQVLPPISLQPDLFRPVENMAVETTPGGWDLAPVECRRFWRHADGRRLAVEFREYLEHKFRVGFMVRRRDHHFIRQLWPVLERWMDAHHYLKGQKFSADGRLLELPAADTWANLVLPNSLRQALIDNTKGLFERADIHRRHQLPLRRGVLLHGPPGTGKTMIGRALARDAGSTFIVVAASDIEEPADVRRVFLLARRLAPTILFFEDLDLIGANRWGDSSRQVLGELLTCLDGIESPDGVIVVATTNDLTAIESALKERPSRFDVVLEVPPLDRDLSEVYIHRWMEQRGFSMTPGATRALRRNRITGAEAQEVCVAASLHAIGRSAEYPGWQVTAEDFAHAERHLPIGKQPRIGFGG